MPGPQGVERAIRRGLAYLGRVQEADGSFVSFSSASMRPFKRIAGKRWHTNFVPALILGSLAVSDLPEAASIRDGLARFLLEQRSDSWSFNYWAAHAPERETQPYPDDLDDTFCALAGIYLHDPALVGDAGLAHAVKLLVAAERGVGGPYRTWLVAPDSRPVWLDVDLAVNSNIAYFLSLIGTRLPKLDALMGRAIAKGEFSSPYYPSRYAFIYYLSRAYEGPQKPRLLKKAIRLQRAARTDMDRTLCLCARLRLGDAADLSGAVDKLLPGQRRDGSWPAATFYADPVENGRLFYNGGPALTTAFAVEALEFYRRSLEASGPARARQEPSGMRRLRSATLASARAGCRDLQPDLRTTLLRTLKSLATSRDGAEIIGAARDFSRSMKHPPTGSEDDLIKELGLSNLYGWTAYTIYDDFLDGEGRPDLLPTANVAARRSLDGFSKARPEDRDFQALVRRVFDTIDSANAWEQARCRFELRGDDLSIRRLPDYADLSKLAERSLGHTLPALALLSASGLSCTGQAFRKIDEALRHYLIARQLNDDAHDWVEDLRNGRITWVLGRLLSGLGAGAGHYRLGELTAESRRQFWHDTLPETCGLMLEHISLSRQALGNSGIMRSSGPVHDLLDRLEASVDETMSKQGHARNFLKHYGAPKTRTAKVRTGKSAT